MIANRQLVLARGLLRRNFGILETLSALQGVDSLGAVSGLTPMDPGHVVPDGRILTPLGMGLSLLRSCDSLRGFCTDSLGLPLGAAVGVVGGLTQLIFTPQLLAGERLQEANTEISNEVADLQLDAQKKRMMNDFKGAKAATARMQGLRSMLKKNMFVWTKLLALPMHGLNLVSTAKHLVTLYTAAGSSAVSIPALKFLWMGNILLPDPFFIMPILAAALSYFLFPKSSILSLAGPLGKYMSILLPAITFFFLCTLPAYTSMYSIGVASMVLLSNRIVKNPKVRAWIWGPIRKAPAYEAPKNARRGQMTGRRSDIIRNH